jgi:putative component of membrane protein insertase Oxa1/YidC/SpoIIIJ protein YidD
MRNNPIIEKKSDKYSHPPLDLKETSEVKLAFSGLIRFYQVYISSQDIPSCNFNLTCSRFMAKAIREHGAFHGILMGSDRLQRCFGPGRKYYPKDIKTGHVIDYPVEIYYIGRDKNKFPLPEDMCTHKGIVLKFEK